MHLKNIAYTMLYASFNRLLWAVHTEHRQASTHARIHAFISRTTEHAPSFVSRFDTIRLLCKTLWHYVIHYGLRLRYILLYIATLTLSTNADKVNIPSFSSLVSYLPILRVPKRRDRIGTKGREIPFPILLLFQRYE